MRQKLSSVQGLLILVLGALLIVFPLLRFGKPLTATQLTSSERSQEAFVAELAPLAKELSKAYGVRPSIIMGQVILASNYGQTYLAHKYHNYLMLEADQDSTTVTLITPVYKNKTWKEEERSFAVYHRWEDSLYDYMAELKEGKWGKDLYTTMSTSQGYKTSARALQEAGFSSDPAYAQKLIKLIEDSKLSQYD